MAEADNKFCNTGASTEKHEWYYRVICQFRLVDDDYAECNNTKYDETNNCRRVPWMRASSGCVVDSSMIDDYMSGMSMIVIQ